MFADYELTMAENNDDLAWLSSAQARTSNQNEKPDQTVHVITHTGISGETRSTPHEESRASDMIWIQSEYETTRYDDVKSSDSVSNIGPATASFLPRRRDSRAQSVTSNASSTRSSASQARIEAAARQAELRIKAEALQMKHDLDNEMQLIQRRREQLELQTEIAATNARLAAIENIEAESQQRQVVEDLRPEYEVKCDIPATPGRAETHGRPSVENYQTSTAIPPDTPTKKFDLTAYLMQQNEVVRQQNDLTKVLVECHMRSSLPQRTLTPFHGNPLEYNAFLRAFQHSVEEKTNNPKDRLYYLEQYTRGEANTMVRSCMCNVNVEAAYAKAREMLEKAFGNKYRITDAIIGKVEDWPEIKADEVEKLTSFSLCLTELLNTARDLGQCHEINHSHNIRMVVSKLPYRLREKWRQRADYIQEERGLSIQFADAVSFVSKEARVLSNPVYGNIKGPQRKAEPSPTNAKPRNERRGFSANVNQPDNVSVKPEQYCLYCKTSTHMLDSCKRLGGKPYGERLQFCKSQGLCYSCLKKSSHFARDCKNRLECAVCNSSHPTILHKQYQQYQRAPTNQEPPQEQATSNQVPHEEEASAVADESISTERVKRSLTSMEEGSNTLPIIIPVTLRSRTTGRKIRTNAFLDNGSNAVFCTQEVKESLQLTGRKGRIQLQTLTEDRLTNCEVISDLEVLDLEEKTSINIDEAYVQAIPISKTEVPSSAELNKYSYLRGIQLPELDAEVGLLIGNNIPEAAEPLEVINSRDGGPFAFRTVLGWAVCGAKRANRPQRISSHRISVKTDLNEQMISMFNRDFSERLIEDTPERSIQDQRFLNIVEGSLQHVDGHFEIAMPLKNKNVSLPTNKPQAEQRLQHLRRKFERQPPFREEYMKFMGKVMDRKFAEKVPEDEIQRDDGRVWYVPHHGVFHPQKRKLRVVYDCAASYKGRSLNTELLQGPDLTNSLVGVLIRFRQDKVAVMADIEAMFSQVRIPKDDRDLLRFLWWPEGDIQRPIEEHRMTVHVFGATSSPACANYALKRTADGQKEDVAKIIKHNFYVDDCLYSTSTAKKATELSEDLQEACRKGGFHLTKWISNDRKVIEAIPKEERASGVQELIFDKEKLPQERALGIIWCAESDSFSVNIQTKPRPLSKRGMLSSLSSVYDPLGFVAPVILVAKALLQNLCRKGIGWDEEIPRAEAELWKEWLADLPRLSEFKMDRCLRPSGYEQAEVSLHHFADASEVGYGTVSYLRLVNNKRETTVSFVMSKARVAPIKQVSIPRMELTAACVAVRVNQMLKRELTIQVKETYYWTDSMTVLRYIQNETARFQTFVANRLAVIHDGSIPDQWRYVNTSLNPADVSSRGMKVQEFLLREDWKNGPEFLLHSEEDWPKTNDEVTDDVNAPLEIKKNCMMGSTKTGGEECAVNKLISHYSDWTRLRRAVAWWLRLKEKLKERAKLSSDKVCTGTLTVAEVNGAELAIVRWVQFESFQEEIEALNQKGNQQSGKAIRKGSSIIKLDPELHDKVLRVGGRLRNAEIDGNAKHQVILPKKHHVSTLIVRHVHQSVAHQGQNHVLAELLQKYWIIGAGVLTKTIIRKCVTCRRYQAKTNTQKMADLPRPRVAACEPPFTYTGMDYFGPFETRRGRSMQKRYGVVFTCMTSRAIHIEVASSLDTSSAIDAIRRFVSRRGSVKTMYSDNGTNLVGACSALKQALQEWSQEQIMNFCCNRGIQWNFNPPAASHFGGVWERQIRTIRKILHAILHEQYLKTAQSDEQLHTLMCEIEAVINSRPLTRASNDPNDLDVITPNHLLQAKMTTSPPPGRFSEKDVYSKKRWRQMQLLADTFWRRWVREYLPTLQQRQKWAQPNRSLQVGDVVLIADKDAPRCSWQMGRVEEVYPGKDGLVRSARIKTKSTTLTRPVIKLCSLLEAE